jgi:hypothetical protein
MKKDVKLDELGRIMIIPKNIYLIKDVNYSEYTSIYEWECLAESEQAYKFLDKIQERIFWVEKNKFHDKAFGRGGYFVFECIYDQKEEQKRLIEQLTKK